MPEKRTVEILAFGSFSIRVGGEPLEFPRRAPVKQLQLLKVLVALGGQAVPSERVCEALWPDADGDRAQQALDTTLSRIRVLLYPDIVRVRDGRLTIDAACRVDVFEFRHALEECKRALEEGDTAGAHESLDLALHLYSAPFLDGEFEPSEIIPPARTDFSDLLRKRLREMGTVLDGINRSDEALRLYSRALAIDDCDEEVCQSLMRSSLSAGKFTEGLAAYDRLQRALHQRWQLAPSDETLAISRRLVEVARSRPAAQGSPGDATPAPGTDSPLELSAQARTSPPTSERRPVTVIAVRNFDYSDLLERVDLEEVQSVTTGLRREARNIMESHGGVLNGFSGARITALFGLAPAHDDDPVRAIRATLALLAAIAEKKLSGAGNQAIVLRPRAGIATGMHLVLPPETPGGTYQLTGPALDAAARLESLAQPASILISSDVQRRVSDFFVLEPVSDLDADGGTGPLGPFRVVGQTSVRTRFQAAQSRGLTPFVGRKRERVVLQERLEQALSGNGQLVEVIGEAGAGKTRLVHEFLKSARGRAITVLEGRCQTFGAETPFLPFLNALRRALQISENEAPATLEDKAIDHFLAIDPALKRYLPHLLYLLSIPSATHRLPETLAGEALRRELEEALIAAIVQQTRSGPLMLILEDWHWADSASDGTLRHLTAMVAQYPILLIVLYRSESSRATRNTDNPTTLVLNALEAAQTDAMLRSVFGVSRVADGLSDTVHSRTSGNALFNEEIARSLLEEGIVSVHGGIATLRKSLDQLRLPETVQAVIRSRVDRLNPDEQNVLRLASVIGREFDRAVLERITKGEVNVGALLEPLSRQDLVRQTSVLPEVQYHFKHVLTQQVIYDTLPQSQRKRLHEQVGLAIEQLRDGRLEEHYEVLAYHFQKSETTAKAIEYLELAAKKSVKRQLLAEAVTQYRSAIDLLDRPQLSESEMRQHIQLSLDLGHIASTFPSKKVNEILLQSEIYAQRLRDDQALGAIALNLGGVYRLEGDIGTALGHLRRAMEIAERSGDDLTRRIAEGNYGQTLFYAAEFSRAIDHLEHSIHVDLSAEESATPATRGNFLALQCTMIGDFERAEQLQTDAIRAAQQEGDKLKEQVARLWLSLRQSLQGDWQESLDTLDITLDLVSTTRVRYIEGYARCGRGMALFMRGETALALKEFEKGLDTLEESEHRLALSLYHAAHAEMLAITGDVEPARGQAIRALDMGNSGEHLGEVAAKRAMAIAEASGSMPDWSIAARHMGDSLRLAVERGQRPDLALGHYRHAELLHKQADMEAARESLSHAVALFRTLRMNGWVSIAEDLETRLESGSPFRAFAPLAR